MLIYLSLLLFYLKTSTSTRDSDTLPRFHYITVPLSFTLLDQPNPQNRIRNKTVDVKLLTTFPSPLITPIHQNVYNSFAGLVLSLFDYTTIDGRNYYNDGDTPQHSISSYTTTTSTTISSDIEVELETEEIILSSHDDPFF